MVVMMVIGHGNMRPVLAGRARLIEIRVTQTLEFQGLLLSDDDFLLIPSQSKAWTAAPVGPVPAITAFNVVERPNCRLQLGDEASIDYCRTARLALLLKHERLQCATRTGDAKSKLKTVCRAETLVGEVGRILPIEREPETGRGPTIDAARAARSLQAAVVRAIAIGVFGVPDPLPLSLVSRHLVHPVAGAGSEKLRVADSVLEIRCPERKTPWRAGLTAPLALRVSHTRVGRASMRWCRCFLVTCGFCSVLIKERQRRDDRPCAQGA